MKNFGIKFIISCVLETIAIALIFMHFYLYAAILLVVAFFPNAKEVKEYSSFYQLINFRVQTLLLGFSVDLLIGDGTYYYTLSMFFLQFTGVLRLELFNIFLTNSKVWVEAFGLVSTYVMYVFACLQHPNRWEGWVLPVLPILFMTYIGTDIIFRAIKEQKVRAEAGEARTELGKKAPGFSLPDIEGRSVNLSDFEKKSHVLLIFVRGDWCPTCHIMIREYEKNRDRFSEKNIIPIGISPDSTEVNRNMMERLGWKNMLLADTTQEIAGKYGILLTKNNVETSYPQGIALPASFLVDMNGILRYVSRSDRAGEFLSPSLIFPIIDRL